MKIEKIEINKIRVTLSALDLVDMNVNVKSLTPNSPRLHSFLYEVMEKVKEETGFNPYTGQVVVEATPNDDGIILMVTKLSEHKEPLKRKPKNIRVAGHRSVKKLTYKFDSFEHLCRLFSCSEPKSFYSAGLYEYMENFYLVAPKNAAAALSEFGDAKDTLSLSESFLEEHGRFHAKGEDLVAMAEGVRELMMC